MKNVDKYDYENFDQGKTEFDNIIKQFFEDFCENYIEHNKEFFNQMQNSKSHLVMPCLECENCNLSSIVCAIDKITKIHLPEYTFQLEDQKRRRIDLWCRLSNNTSDEKPYDFFIELKTHSNNSKTEMEDVTKERLKKLIDQVKSMKEEIKPDWGGNNIYLGLMIIPDYNSSKSEENAQSIEDLKKGITNITKNKYQVMFASWNFPKEIKDYIKNYKTPKPGVGHNRLYNWVLIMGIALTKDESKQ